MAVCRIIGCIIISFTILSMPGCITAEGGGDRTVDNNGCLKKYNITRGTSPWQGFTSTAEEEEQSKTIQAVKLEGTGYRAIPSLEKYSRAGRLIIGRDEKLRKVAVEAEFFSMLRRADATRNIAGRFQFGTCREGLLRIFTAAEIAEFLVESQIISTFWHVESQFCLVDEIDAADTYTAHYKGRHIYFTNSRNEEPLDFSIIIDKKTGEIFIEIK